MQFAAFPAAMLSSEVNKVFATYDVDGSGFLSRDEFKTAYVKFCGRYHSCALM
jgi:Ca2+-binding EF-hand superfamily protein